jgi:hypothetical protein
MYPALRPPEEVRLKRTAMSTRELRRAEVLTRVKSQTLRLVDAAKMLEVRSGGHSKNNSKSKEKGTLLTR